MNSSAASPASANQTGRAAVEVPHVTGHATWIRAQRGTTYLHIAASCCFCGLNHSHVAAGPRVSGCGRLYIVDVPMAELSGGAL
jgi:hypothetical protein